MHTGGRKVASVADVLGAAWRTSVGNFFAISLFVLCVDLPIDMIMVRMTEPEKLLFETVAEYYRVMEIWGFWIGTILDMEVIRLTMTSLHVASISLGEASARL